jgi:hypothetical protein
VEDPHGGEVAEGRRGEVTEWQSGKVAKWRSMWSGGKCGEGWVG